jgi:hypothetical protein
MRVPEPSGTQVYVSSCPAGRRQVLEVRLRDHASVFRSGWKCCRRRRPSRARRPRSSP